MEDGQDDDEQTPRRGDARGPAAAPPGRFRRFVRTYGWRAYAIPVLAVATFLALLEVVSLDSVAEEPPARSQETGVTSSSSDGEPTTTAPTTPPTTTTAPTTLPASTSMPTVGAEPVDPSATFTGEPASPTFVQRGEGTLSVVPGRSDILGDGAVLRFRVEVENGLNVDGVAFARAVEATLGDPRGWGNGGRQAFQRVAAGPFDFRVALVSPDNVNSFCSGLDTGGYTSCRSGNRAVINLARWETAVPDYEGDIPTYRQYVVNHEVGHYLGHGHESCRRQGALAPVMQQQTLGLDGCRKNPWPYP